MLLQLLPPLLPLFPVARGGVSGNAHTCPAAVMAPPPVQRVHLRCALLQHLFAPNNDPTCGLQTLLASSARGYLSTVMDDCERARVYVWNTGAPLRLHTHTSKSAAPKLVSHVRFTRLEKPRPRRAFDARPPRSWSSLLRVGSYPPARRGTNGRLVLLRGGGGSDSSLLVGGAQGTSAFPVILCLVRPQGEYRIGRAQQQAANKAANAAALALAAQRRQAQRASERARNGRRRGRARAARKEAATEAAAVDAMLATKIADA